MPFQDFRFLTDAFARLGIKPPAGFNPGQMSTSAAGTLSDIVSNPSGSARLNRARAQGVIDIETARQRGVAPANPIKGFNVSSANPLGRGVTAPTIGTGTPRPPVIGPTITGPAPNTFGAPYIRDPGLARQFVQRGLPRNVPRSPVPGIPQPMGLMGKLGKGFGFLSAAATGAELGNITGTAGANYIIQNHPETAKQIQNTLLQIPGLRDYRDSVRAQNRAGTTAFNQALRSSSLPSLDENYAKEELEQSRLAEQFRPGAGFPGQQAPIPPALPDPIITAPPVPGQQAGNAGAMETYMQLKQQAKTPEDYKRLDQLGMAIHQEKFGTPGMRMEQTIGTFNPLMAQMGLQQPARSPVASKEEASKQAQEFLKKLTKFNKQDEK